MTLELGGAGIDGDGFMTRSDKASKDGIGGRVRRP
jgi:hypothetical protein